MGNRILFKTTIYQSDADVEERSARDRKEDDNTPRKEDPPPRETIQILPSLPHDTGRILFSALMLQDY